MVSLLHPPLSMIVSVILTQCFLPGRLPAYQPRAIRSAMKRRSCRAYDKHAVKRVIRVEVPFLPTLLCRIISLTQTCHILQQPLQKEEEEAIMLVKATTTATVNAMQAATAAIIMINFCWQQSPLVKAPYTVFYYSVNSINDSVLTIKK